MPGGSAVVLRDGASPSVDPAVALKLDLAFDDPSLEEEYRIEHNKSQLIYDVSIRRSSELPPPKRPPA